MGADGELVCWGREMSELPPPGRYRAVSTNGVHACALTEGGEAVCWGGRGWNNFGETEPPPGRYVAISVGFRQGEGAHPANSCALAEDGAVVCWGWAVGEATDGAQAQHLDGHPALRFAGPYSSVVSGAGIGFCAVTIAGEGECRGGWPPIARVAGPFGDAPTPSDVGARRRCSGQVLGRRREQFPRLRSYRRGTGGLRNRLTVGILQRDADGDEPARSRALTLHGDRGGVPSRLRLDRLGRGRLLGSPAQQVGASRSAAGAVRGRERRPVPHLRADRCRRGGLLGVEQPRTGRRARGALHGDRRRLDAYLRVDRCRRGDLLGSGRRGGHTPRPPRGDQRGLLGRLRPGSRAARPPAGDRVSSRLERLPVATRRSAWAVTGHARSPTPARRRAGAIEQPSGERHRQVRSRRSASATANSMIAHGRSRAREKSGAGLNSRHGRRRRTATWRLPRASRTRARFRKRARRSAGTRPATAAARTGRRTPSEAATRPSAPASIAPAQSRNREVSSAGAMPTTRSGH